MRRFARILALAALLAIVFVCNAHAQGIPAQIQSLRDRVDIYETIIAQLRARLEQVETAALTAQIKNEVTEFQVGYNRDFDACIALGSVTPHTDPGFQYQLNKIVNRFCPDGEFEGWRAWYKGAVAGNIPTTRAEIAARYDNYCGVQFVNVSRHLVSNIVVQPFIGNDGRQYAVFNASITQFDFQSNMPNFQDALPGAWNNALPAGWNMNLGWYNNIYLRQANGQWCIKRFDAYTSNLELFPVVSLGQSFEVFMN